ncbi:MAG: adenylate/guanylate cyclase domain-containing protein [Candidatus Aminicenantes bacterium]|nr:adenylate/guanylate cyclase domain-containing protein [Candidatus Aminicenantes bacterium]
MKAFFVIERPGRERSRVELGNTTSIGRATANSICLKEDGAASRQHALVRRQGETEYSLLDLGSANGTYLNEKLLLVPAILRHGDCVRVGDTILRFEFHGDPASNLAGTQTVYERTQMAVRMSRMTILVCDIRDFTRIGEILAPDVLSRFLGSWFRDASEAILSRGGVVDKFIGDAVMAYWPVVPATPSGAAENAVETAVTLHRLAERVELPGYSDFSFRIGIGINQGLVSCGNIGVQSGRDLTIMGDAVTLAFRLESVCKVKKIPIVVGAEIASVLGGSRAWIPLGEVHLKGKTTSPEAFGLEVKFHD